MCIAIETIVAMIPIILTFGYLLLFALQVFVASIRTGRCGTSHISAVGPLMGFSWTAIEKATNGTI